MKVDPLFNTAKVPPQKVEAAPLFSKTLDRVLNESIPEVTIETTMVLPHPKVYVPKPLFANSTPAAVIDPSAKVVASTLNLPGMRIRHRWEPTIDDLVRIAPEISDPVAINRARNIITDTNTDTETFAEFGLEYQQQHAASASQMLELVTDPLIQKVAAGIHNITEMVSGNHKRWTSWQRPSPSTPTIILQTAEQLSKDILDSDVVRQHVEELAARLPSIGAGLSSIYVAGKYLLTVMADGPSRITLEKRVDSISVTAVSLSQMRLQVATFIATLSYRHEVVLSTVVNLVPLWCQNYSLASTAEAKTYTQKILVSLKGA